jgi:hypothetical protein
MNRKSAQLARATRGRIGLLLVVVVANCTGAARLGAAGPSQAAEKVAADIRREAALPSNGPVGRPLPLVSHWNMFQAMRKALVSDAWKKNVRFVGYGAFGPSHLWTRRPRNPRRAGPRDAYSVVRIA